MQLDSLDESIEGWEPATHDELHHVKYPPDLAKLVQEASSKTTSDGIDLQKDVQPYDAESDGVCELTSETAEWWGPEWQSEAEDARYSSMTPVRCPHVASHCTFHKMLLGSRNCVPDSGMKLRSLGILLVLGKRFRATLWPF